MRLTHIKLAGFKTFVDPTTIPVPGQRVGVVGPNGCGKSNVIDAVRWVMGESRAAALRGESMQDVIFNGAATRKAVSRASVELKFDNSLGKAAGQWSQYAEISVKRVLHRNGESQYFINNLHVRRRDVTDMFLGTGLGPRAYAIIEQGMISRIIEARPEDLRIFLEEAAGISRYKERRRETESRLKDTRDNLARVEDIRQELDKQLQRLEVQAQVAQHYHQLQQASQTTQHLLWLVKKQEALLARERAHQQVDKLVNELEAETATLRQSENQLETARADHFAAGDALHAAQGELYAANAEVAKLEQQLQHERETHNRLTSQLGAWRNQQSQLQQQYGQAEESLALWRAERETAQCNMQESADTVGEERERLPQMEAAFRECQRRHGDLQRELTQLEQALQIEEAHRSHARKTVQQLETRRERLQQEAAGLPQPDQAELERRRGELEEMAGELAHCQAQQHAFQAGLPALEQAQHAAQQAAHTAQQRATKIDAQLHALRQMQSRLEHNHKLKDWLAGHQLDGLPRLWNSIRIEAGWEAALESVLGERLKAVALESIEVASAWLVDTPPAPLALYEARAPGIASATGTLTPLRQRVEGPAGLLDEWLHGVYATSSVDEAWALRHQLQPGECLVCREGHVFTRSSVNFYAPQSELHGVLARQREIEALAGELEQTQAEMAARQGEAARTGNELKGAQHELAELRRTGGDIQQRHHRQQLETERMAQQQQHLSQRREQIGHEIGDIAAQLEIEMERIGEHDYNIERQQEQIAGLHEQLEDAKTVRGESEMLLNRQRQLAQAAERAAQEAVYQHKNCVAKIDEFERAVAALARQLEELAGRIAELEGEAGSLQQGKLDALLQQALLARKEQEGSLAAARDALAEAGNALQQLEQQRLASEHKLHPLRDRLEQARLKEQEARLAEEQWQEQLDAADADPESLWPLLEKRPRATELQGEVERLAQEIEALGAVNLAALEELNNGRERKQYLDAQFQDLSEAMDTLEQAIRRIDRETRARLQETFDTVNRHFGELFPAVFGGGNARLEMTGEEILDAGVTLIAQPPGKKNSSIHLLSGGEKALTALALVFAMFRLNPAPFCMLDEVDAPLDDSNTERFCELVKKMSQQTQFIYVSHNKITMEMAEHLVGVTMQESGVSRVVAVDLEEAVKLKDAAAL
ncbi:chromosome partition protein Smc [Sulfurimicrobium lacus]|uniref:Chromosome partition protein Smc n=1 Tax=Sulfurimicrobium lacus TaxID=2715678 RepID=A0A6F8VC81_9PROT|nr:chromosome segregation protein SMC [Sulfurimicrobium lacus]BCB27274.1 chromosome partition protein Smc [Sulfurimicrobium lacus]